MPSDLIRKLQQLQEYQNQARQKATENEAAKAEYEMDNMSNAHYYPNRAPAEEGFYLNKPEEYENTPSVRYLKLMKLLEQKD